MVVEWQREERFRREAPEWEMVECRAYEPCFAG